MFKNLLCLLLIMVIGNNLVQSNPQFWKMNTMSERDMFILDVKSTMSAGICYKKIE